MLAEFDFRFVWEGRDAATERDAQAFWRALRAFGPEQVAERTSELCAVAYADSEVAGVSTVRLFEFRPLRARLAFYRTMVASGLRRLQLASQLCAYSRDQLAGWAREHPEEKLKGLFIVLEAEEFRSRQHAPVIKQLDLELIFVGYATDGNQLRVVWFDDATVE